MAIPCLGMQRESVTTSPIGRELSASIAFGVGFRNVSAQVQGVGIALHDSASSRTAYAVFVVPQWLKCSFSWSWFRWDESEIHQDSCNQPQSYCPGKRPARDNRYKSMFFCVRCLGALKRRRLQLAAPRLLRTSSPEHCDELCRRRLFRRSARERLRRS